jgi:hypothetical protein
LVTGRGLIPDCQLYMGRAKTSVHQYFE